MDPAVIGLFFGGKKKEPEPESGGVKTLVLLALLLPLATFLHSIFGP